MSPECEHLYRRFVGVGVDTDTREPLTTKQREAMEAYLRHDRKLKKAAEAIGMTSGGFYSCLATIRSKGYNI